MKTVNSTSSFRTNTNKKRQLGSTAVEFALLFPVLFAVLYGTITYGYAFFIQHQINLAAEQGARAAVAFVGAAGPTTAGARCGAATSAIQAFAVAEMSTLERSFLGTPSCTTVPVPTLVAASAPLFGTQITLTFNFLGMLPAITLPGIGNIPVLPNLLTASATVLE